MNAFLSTALAKTLLYSLWQGAAVALALAVLLSFVRSSRVRYAASCLAMLLLLTSFVATFIRFAPHSTALTPSALLTRIVVSSPVFTDSSSVPPVAPRTDYSSWIAPLWIAGVLIFYLRSAAAWVAERRLRTVGICIAPEHWRTRIEQLRSRLRLARPVTLLESSLAEVPMVVGYLRPIVLVPVGLLTAMPVSQVEAILLHELAHIRRYDYPINLLQVCLEGLLFYHPAVWWVSDVMRTERENCCDDTVVALSGGAYEYAAALESLEHRRTVATLALAATDGNLVNRIARLLGKPAKRSALPAPVLVAAILGIASVTATVALQPAKPAAPKTRTITAQKPTPQTPAARAAEKPVLIAQAALAPATPGPQPTGERRIAAGDLLVFTVFEQPDMSKSQTVRPDGAITFPFLGSLHAAGKTQRELQIEITQSVIRKNLLLHPVIDIGIGDAGPREIAVAGSVKNPGHFAISEPIHILDALAKAGWLTEDAGSRVLISRLTPGDREETTIEQLQMNPAVIRPLIGGETITVTASPRIMITGNVTRPGPIRLSESSNATVLRVIEQAGVSQTNDPAVYIYRSAGNRPRFEIPVSLSAIRKHEAEDVPLIADDIILVQKTPEDPRDLLIRRMQMLLPAGAAL